MPGRFIKARGKFDVGVWTLGMGVELDRVLHGISDAISSLVGTPQDPTDVAPDNVAYAGGVRSKPASEDHVHEFPVEAPAGLGNANAEGSSNAGVRSDHVHKRDVRVAKAGADVGTRNRLNFIEGAGVTLTIGDDAGNDEVDVTVASSATFGGTPTTIQPDDAAAAGSGPAAAYFDHRHAIVAAVAVDLGDANTEGASTSFARADHVHKFPARTPVWTKYTVTHTALQAAAMANDIELFSLPAAGVIHGIKIRHTVLFAGTGITDYKVSVGIVGNLTKYASAFDVDTAVSGTNFQLTSVVGSEDNGSAFSIRVAATSAGANLNQSSAGTVEIWALVSTAG